MQQTATVFLRITSPTPATNPERVYDRLCFWLVLLWPTHKDICEPGRGTEEGTHALPVCRYPRGLVLPSVSGGDGRCGATCLPAKG